jgi:hypothetical protein
MLCIHVIHQVRLGIAEEDFLAVHLCHRASEVEDSRVAGEDFRR